MIYGTNGGSSVLVGLVMPAVEARGNDGDKTWWKVRWMEALADQRSAVTISGALPVGLLSMVGIIVVSGPFERQDLPTLDRPLLFPSYALLRAHLAPALSCLLTLGMKVEQGILLTNTVM